MFHFYYLLMIKSKTLNFFQKIVNKNLAFMNPICNDGVQKAELCVCA